MHLGMNVYRNQFAAGLQLQRALEEDCAKV